MQCPRSGSRVPLPGSSCLRADRQTSQGQEPRPWSGSSSQFTDMTASDVDSWGDAQRSVLQARVALSRTAATRGTLTGEDSWGIKPWESLPTPRRIHLLTSQNMTHFLNSFCARTSFIKNGKTVNKQSLPSGPASCVCDSSTMSSLYLTLTAPCEVPLTLFSLYL